MDPLTIAIGTVIGGTLTAGFNFLGHRVKAAGDLARAGATKAEANAETLTAAAVEHQTEVTEREGWRKRTTALENQVQKLIEQVEFGAIARERAREEKFSMQDQILELKTQLAKVSDQLVLASAREIKLTADLAAMIVEVTALRVELAKYQKGAQQ